MNQPEREMMDKLITAIEDNTKAQRELTKVHAQVFEYLSIILPAFFLAAGVVYCMIH